MITLDHLLIEEAVLTQNFACDVQRCKGACCTMPGGAGAPLADSEVPLIHEAAKHARSFLTASAVRHLDNTGGVEGASGGFATACIDDAACVFVAFDGDVATCSIERAWHAGLTTFRKPLSCHLFPIRIANFGGPYVHYEQIDECVHGRKLGAELGLPLVVALKDALTRAYGDHVYANLVNAARREEEAT